MGTVTFSRYPGAAAVQKMRKSTLSISYSLEKQYLIICRIQLTVINAMGDRDKGMDAAGAAQLGMMKWTSCLTHFTNNTVYS